ALAGCTKGGQFDPTEIFDNDMFETKKKLTGDRQPIFPGGVPGTTTGVPADLVKGYKPPPDTDADAVAPAYVGGTPPPDRSKPVAEAKPKPKPRPKPRVATTGAPAASQPTRINIGAKSATPPQSSSAPWPAPQQAPQSAQTAWPAPPAGQSSQTVWPAPPPTGTATH